MNTQEDEVWKHARKLIDTKNWHAAAICRGHWMRKTWEAMPRKWAEEPQEEETKW
jgi:hypothetical protein